MCTPSRADIGWPLAPPFTRAFSLCLAPLASTTLLVARSRQLFRIPAYASPSISPIFPREHCPRKYSSRYPGISANILRDVLSSTFAPIAGLPSPPLSLHFASPPPPLGSTANADTHTAQRLYNIYIIPTGHSRVTRTWLQSRSYIFSYTAARDSTPRWGHIKTGGHLATVARTRRRHHNIFR